MKLTKKQVNYLRRTVGGTIQERCPRCHLVNEIDEHGGQCVFCDTFIARQGGDEQRWLIYILMIVIGIALGIIISVGLSSLGLI